ncbi:MAG: hypothetical protein AMS20_11845 [Gemmatimonas sp. SG8_28]|nr:MAG: hypothetical protein AMS20_11845 [Gemmatimonas sp. SG8_28]
MQRIRRSKSTRGVLLPSVLVIWLSACATKWVEVGPPVDTLREQAVLPAEDRDRLRLHVAGSEETHDGTLEGLSRDSVALSQYREERATVAISQVSQVEVERPNWPGVIALSVVGLAFLAAVVSVAAFLEPAGQPAAGG